MIGVGCSNSFVIARPAWRVVAIQMDCFVAPLVLAQSEATSQRGRPIVGAPQVRQRAISENRASTAALWLGICGATWSAICASEAEMNMRLSELAARRLEQAARGGRSPSAPADSNAAALQAQWTLAALRSMASAQTQDPDLASLRALTDPATLWPQSRPLSAEQWQHSIDSLRACQWLAIANADRRWLAQLRRCWEAAPAVIGPWWPLLALGEIALATQQAPARLWSDEDVDALLDESMLRAAAPADRAWMALNQGHPADARVATVEYEALLARWYQVLGAAAADDPDEAALLQVLAQPASVLRLQARALWALIAAAERAGAGVPT